MKKLFVLAVALLLIGVAPSFAQQGKSAAIAVAANGNSASAAVGGQLGRSAFFLLFDANGTFLSAEGNPYKDSGNAGIPALDLLAGKGVKIVVAEGFGGRIADVIKEKGMRAVEFKGSAQDAAKKAAQAK